jgi:nucleotide-binding universal stress UspA family protein
MLPVKKILCPLDFSGASQTALRTADEFAQHFQAQLVLVHVVPVLPPVHGDPNFAFSVPEYESALHADAQRQLTALADELGKKGVIAQTVVAHGDAGGEIIRAAEASAVDLIVIATHGMTGWRHVMFGSVASKVVRIAGRPVLVVPSPRD